VYVVVQIVRWCAHAGALDLRISTDTACTQEHLTKHLEKESAKLSEMELDLIQKMMT